jgi:hypothetical protein
LNADFVDFIAAPDIAPEKILIGIRVTGVRHIS